MLRCPFRVVKSALNLAPVLRCHLGPFGSAGEIGMLDNAHQGGVSVEMIVRWPVKVGTELSQEAVREIQR